MRVSNEKCKKAAKTKGLSLLKTFGIGGFSYVANATTEPAGEVAFLIFSVRPVNLPFKILFFGNFTGD